MLGCQHHFLIRNKLAFPENWKNRKFGSENIQVASFDSGLCLISCPCAVKLEKRILGPNLQLRFYYDHQAPEQYLVLAQLVVRSEWLPFWHHSLYCSTCRHIGTLLSISLPDWKNRVGNWANYWVSLPTFIPTFPKDRQTKASVANKGLCWMCNSSHIWTKRMRAGRANWGWKQIMSTYSMSGIMPGTPCKSGHWISTATLLLPPFYT